VLAGFKEFIFRGNVIDLAVGVIIGAAFGTIVTSMTEDVITPLIGMAGGLFRHHSRPNSAWKIHQRSRRVPDHCGCPVCLDRGTDEQVQEDAGTKGCCGSWPSTGTGDAGRYQAA
jgi:hypothetical protein